jgi:SAM-dependent methyltransferase
MAPDPSHSSSRRAAFDPVSEAAFFDTWNATGGPKYPRDEVVRFCLRRYPERPQRTNVRALDLGCGGGVHTLFLAAEGFDTAACDISLEGVALTSRRLAERGLKAETAVASFDSAPFPSRSFDLILCIDVLECAAPGLAEAALPSIAKLLKPKGAGFFVFASDKDYRIADPNNPFVRRGFTEGEVKSMFKAAFPFIEINRHVATEKHQSIALDEWMVTAAFS